jgi:hypothetical protein
MNERRELLRQVSDALSRWDDCRIFAECTDKRSFKGLLPKVPPFEEAFTQVVSRFHSYLESLTPLEHGLLVQDRNETMAKRLTDLMRVFHRSGTRWITEIQRIVETPLFVDSQFTSMVQVSDMCAYATRRFLEANDTDLFTRIFAKFHRDGKRLVGARHYVGTRSCHCRICSEH